MQNASPSQQIIGIAGVGLMGAGIASNLVKKGWQLNFVEHKGNQPVDELIAAGAKGVSSGKALAEVSNIIILCVTGSPQVEEILTGSNGVLGGLKAGSMIIDCSTAIPSSTKLLARKVEEAGGRFIDAPMTRTPKEAMEGRLNLIVGAEKVDFDAVLPVLECFAENITHVGEVGAGHGMKLLHNYVSLGFSAVLAEAAASASLAGIEPSRFVEVLSSGGGKSVVLERLAPFIQQGDPSGLLFSLANAAKDIGYYRQMAGSLGAGQDVADGVYQLFSDYVGKGEGERMLPELISLLAAEQKQIKE